MMNFFRSLFIVLVGLLFQLIPPLYRLFYDLASATFFQQETIKTFSKNLYVLLSVVMLFAFAVKAIESIINPDLLFDSKKGFTGVLKRSIIALLLIIIIPFAFDKFYEYQNEIMSKSLIEKMILGVNIEGDNSGNTTENTAENTTGNTAGNTADKTGAGQMMAGLTLSSVLYLNGDNEVYEDMSDAIEAYTKAIGGDIGQVFKLVDDINEKKDGADGEEYVFEFHPLVAIGGGIFILYCLALFCLDTAERVVRLGFLQLTAPISVIAYVYGGNDILKNWTSETTKTAVSVFIRIAGLAFLIFVLYGLPDFTAGITEENGIYKTLVTILVIVGALMFIKEVPKVIEKIFGVSVGGKGGIKGRLGNMFGADVAKKALKAGAILGTGAALLGGKALGGLVKGADNKFNGGKGAEAINKLKNKATDLMQNTKGGQILTKGGQILTKTGQNIRRVGKAVSTGSKEEGGVLKSIQAAQKSYNENPYTKQQKMEENAKFQKDIGVENGVVIGTNNDRGHVANDKLIDTLNNDSKMPSSKKKALNDKIIAARNKESISNFAKAHSGVKSLFDTAITNANSNGDKALAQKLEDLRAGFDKGDITTSQLDAAVKTLHSNGDVSGAFTNDIIGKLNTIDNMKDNDSYIKSLNLTNSNGGISSQSINDAVTSAESIQKSKDDSFELIYNNSSDKEKEHMDRYTGAAETISKQYAYENGKAQGTNVDHHQKV